MRSLCVIAMSMSLMCVVRSILCDVVCLCMWFMVWLVFAVCVSIASVCFVCDDMLCCPFFDVGLYDLFVACCVAGCVFVFIGLSCVYALLVLFCVVFGVLLWFECVPCLCDCILCPVLRCSFLFV